MQGLNYSEKVLLVLLSTTLFVFLILGIVVLINFIKIQRSVLKTATNIEEFTTKASMLSDMLQKTSPLLKMFSLPADLFKKRK
jgi:cell division protein FtsL